MTLELGSLVKFSFTTFFSNPANASGNAGKSCGVHDCFHKLVVRHVDIIEKLFFQFEFIAARFTQKLPMYQFTPIIPKMVMATFAHDSFFFLSALKIFSSLGENEMICQAVFKDATVKLTQKKAIPLTAAVLIKALRALTRGSIDIK